MVGPVGGRTAQPARRKPPSRAARAGRFHGSRASPVTPRGQRRRASLSIMTLSIWVAHGVFTALAAPDAADATKMNASPPLQADAAPHTQEARHQRHRRGQLGQRHALLRRVGEADVAGAEHDAGRQPLQLDRVGAEGNGRRRPAGELGAEAHQRMVVRQFGRLSFGRDLQPHAGPLGGGAHGLEHRLRPEAAAAAELDAAGGARHGHVHRRAVVVDDEVEVGEGRVVGRVAEGRLVAEPLARARASRPGTGSGPNWRCGRARWRSAPAPPRPSP